MSVGKEKTLASVVSRSAKNMQRATRPTVMHNSDRSSLTNETRLNEGSRAIVVEFESRACILAFGDLATRIKRRISVDFMIGAPLTFQAEPGNRRSHQVPGGLAGTTQRIRKAQRRGLHGPQWLETTRHPDRIQDNGPEG